MIVKTFFRAYLVTILMSWTLIIEVYNGKFLSGITKPPEKAVNKVVLNILLIADDDLFLDLPEEGFQDEGFEDIVEGEYTNGQGLRNGYNLIDRSSVSSNFGFLVFYHFTKTFYQFELLPGAAAQ